MSRRPFASMSEIMFTQDGKWRPSKMNKTCFSSLCLVEAFGSLDEMVSGKISNHNQLYNIVIENYDLLKKGMYGMTKTAYKKAIKESGSIEPFIDKLTKLTNDIDDWSRTEKIGYTVDLMSSADETLVFPEEVMNRIRKANVRSAIELSGKEKDVVWFCIQSIEERTTKNNKVFYRMKVMDNNSESCWVRVWGRFDKIPDLYTMWLAEVASTESWGCSTSSYKMKQLTV